MHSLAGEFPGAGGEGSSCDLRCFWYPRSAPPSPPRRSSRPPATIPVGVVRAELKPISKTADFVGRVESINRVQIVARVTGFLEEVKFKEGDVVKEGAPLYLIEQGLFKAAVEPAQGALERSKAAKTLTEIQLSRAQELLNRQAGTAVTRDQALASDQQAAGQILTDQANLDTAKINLGYTEITSPIDRQDRPHQHHQGQCGRPGQRAR